MASINLGVAEQFVSAAWDKVPADQRLLIWTIPRKESIWCDSIDNVVATLNSQHRNDVYIGAGMAPVEVTDVKMPWKVRATNEQISAIPGFWCDMDYESGAHKNEGYPSQEWVFEFIDGMELRPTIVVHSGHGYQLWWLFDQPWVFSSDVDRVDAQTLLQRLQATIRVQVVEAGYRLDYSHDLARVMRLPGSVNYKHQPLEAVTIESHDDVRYTVEHFRRLRPVSDESNYPPTHAPQTAEEFNVTQRIDAKLPDELLAELMIDQDFARTWRKQRNDLPSSSEYDFALASRMLNLGLTQQQVVDGLIQWRRVHGEAGRTDRADYYARILRKIEPTKVDYDPPDVAESDAIREAIEDELKCKVVGFSELVESSLDEKRTGEVVYFLVTDGARITLTAADLDSAAFFRRKIMPHTQRVYPKLKGERFHNLITNLFAIMESEQRSMDESSHAQMLHLLVMYIRRQPRLRTDWQDIILSQMSIPFIHKGYVCIRISHVEEWLHDHRRGMPLGDVGIKLREIGGEKQRLEGSTGGARVSAWVWKLPKTISEGLIASQITKQLGG